MSPTRLLRLAVLAAWAGALAGCETTSGSRPTVMLAPMTRTRAAAECWMATEKTAQNMNLDRRADIVNVCIDKKLKGEPTA